MKKRLAAVLLLVSAACTVPSAPPQAQPRASSGVKKATQKVTVGQDGLTVEQRNVADRLKVDNLPGSIKHLYVLSAYSGQTIIYSTVRGKVTSGGKRLSPSTVAAGQGLAGQNNRDPVGFGAPFGDYRTAEVLGDDGTYGSSGDYLFWWDTKGTYHQHYLSGGQIVHISDQPVAVKGVLINMVSSDDE